MTASTRSLRSVLGDRDGWACHYCGELLDAASSTVEHIWPRCLGGPTMPSNCVLSCAPCNNARGCEPVKCWCRRCRLARVHVAAHHGRRLRPAFSSGTSWRASDRWVAAGLLAAIAA